MKNIISVIFITLLSVHLVFGQDQDAIKSSLSESKSSFQSEDFENTRFKLQQALSELYILLGNEVLKMLPESLEDLPANKESDEVLGNPLGITGINVHRTYGNRSSEEPNANFDIISNSPFLSIVNSFLTNPLFMNKADGSQKVVKIHSYKALVKKEENASGKVDHYEIQIPMGSSLFTMNFYNYQDEATVLKVAHKPDMPAISKLIEGH